MNKYILFLILIAGCRRKEVKPDIMKSPNDFQTEGLLSLNKHFDALSNATLINGYRCMAVGNMDSANYYKGQLEGIHLVDSVVLVEIMKLNPNYKP